MNISSNSALQSYNLSLQYANQKAISVQSGASSQFDRIRISIEAFAAYKQAMSQDFVNIVADQIKSNPATLVNNVQVQSSNLQAEQAQQTQGIE
jgi:hypothetical protein